MTIPRLIPGKLYRVGVWDPGDPHIVEPYYVYARPAPEAATVATKEDSKATKIAKMLRSYNIGVAKGTVVMCVSGSARSKEPKFLLDERVVNLEVFLPNTTIYDVLEEIL